MQLIIIFALSLFSFSGLSSANSFDNQSATEKNIIVTLPPLSGLVAMLLPEKSSQCLLSASADPHHFQPSPKQVALFKTEHLFIRASFDDQGWPIPADQSQAFDLWPHDAHGWLRFDLVREVLPRLAKELILHFPPHEQQIQQNLTQALSLVNEQESEWQSTLEELKKRGVFMQHPSWLGLMESNTIPVWEVLESHQHGHEHGPRQLEHAVHNFEEHPGALLLGSLRHSNRSLEWLSRNHGENNIIKLDAIDTCNTPWNILMQKNLQRLRAN